MARVYRDEEIDLQGLAGRSVAVLGYGAEGEAHALCLRDSGIAVLVGVPDPSRGGTAEAEGLQVASLGEACARADVIVVPGERAELPEEAAGALAPGDTILLTHPGAVGRVRPPAGVDVGLVAPQATPGLFRRRFVDGAGVPGLVAVTVDSSGRTRALALSYARALGLTRAGVWETSVAEAAEAAALASEAFGPGGAQLLWEETLRVLVESGCDPDVAYLTCVRAQSRFGQSPPPPVPAAPPRHGRRVPEEVLLLDAKDVRARLQERLDRLRADGTTPQGGISP